MDSESIPKGYIRSPLYDQIESLIPIVSVEALIVEDGSLLFLRRINQPAKDLWWFPGGRVYKGESLQETLHREIKEETNLEITKSKLINVYSRIFPQRHDITIAYLCNCEKAPIVLDNEHSEYKLFKTVPSNLHPYLVETIKDSQWQKHSKKL